MHYMQMRVDNFSLTLSITIRTSKHDDLFVKDFDFLSRAVKKAQTGAFSAENTGILNGCETDADKKLINVFRWLSNWLWCVLVNLDHFANAFYKIARTWIF